MKTNKKGVELSMNMVIILAILVVLLIIAILFLTGGFEDFGGKLKEFRGIIWSAKPNITLSGN